jgi:acetyl esterase
MTGAEAAARLARRRGEHLPQPLSTSELAEDRVVAGVRVRVFTPAEVDCVYLHLHGGGFVYGGARLQDERLEFVATACRAAVVSVEYRLAPEHPYPAAPDDCEAVAVWLAEHAGAEIGSDRLAIGGESAGANLAVTTLLRLRDRHGYTGFAAASLSSGCFDLELNGFVETEERSLVRDELEPLFAAYAGTVARDDPELSPVHADLHDLPVAQLVAGSLDPLLQDTLLLADRWRRSGNLAEVVVLDGGVHGVDASPELASFLERRWT